MDSQLSLRLEQPLPGKPHLAQGQANEGWYTPAEYIQAARSLWGNIDLDPASCEAAQRVVKAARYYTKADNGLIVPWHAATLWLNPPYTKRLVDQFAAKLATEYQAGLVKEAIWLTNNTSDTGWYHNLAQKADALYQPRGRTRFWTEEPDGSVRTGAPLQGQHLLYFGHRPAEFIAAYRRFVGGIGWIKP